MAGEDVGDDWMSAGTAFISHLMGNTNFSRWTDLKKKLCMTSEVAFIDWLLFVGEDFHGQKLLEETSDNVATVTVKTEPVWVEEEVKEEVEAGVGATEEDTNEESEQNVQEERDVTEMWTSDCEAPANRENMSPTGSVSSSGSLQLNGEAFLSPMTSAPSATSMSSGHKRPNNTVNEPDYFQNPQDIIFNVEKNAKDIFFQFQQNTNLSPQTLFPVTVVTMPPDSATSQARRSERKKIPKRKFDIEDGVSSLAVDTGPNGNDIIDHEAGNSSDFDILVERVEEDPEEEASNQKASSRKYYSCAACDYRSQYKSHMVRHTLKHSGQHPYRCPYCPYGSVWKCHLESHIRTHTGERPFKCKDCEFAAKQKNDLLRHMRTKHGYKFRQRRKPYKLSKLDGDATQCRGIILPPVAAIEAAPPSLTSASDAAEQATPPQQDQPFCAKLSPQTPE